MALPHWPFIPLPFLAAEHASQVVLQALLQQNPSTQNPDTHSVTVRQVFPSTHGTPQLPAGLPPQSMSVSVPFFCWLSQGVMPPQPSGQMPQVLPSAAQVFGVQPQTLGVPPPPHVCGLMQSALVVQAQ